MSDKLKKLREKIGPLIAGNSFCNECRDWFKDADGEQCPDCYPVVDNPEIITEMQKMSEIRLFVGGKYPATIVGTGNIGEYDDTSITIKWDSKPEKHKDRTGIVQINREGIITGWKFTNTI